MPLSPKARGGIGGLYHTLTNSKILKKLKKFKKFGSFKIIY